MLSGFNTNFRYRGVLFHVQTEDSGLENPHVITHLFHGGNIMASEKCDYSELLSAHDGDALENAVKKMMEGQHKSMLKGLSRGEHDSVIEQRMGADVFRVADAPDANDPPSSTEEELPGPPVPADFEPSSEPLLATPDRPPRMGPSPTETPAPSFLASSESSPASQTTDAEEPAQAEPTQLDNPVPTIEMTQPVSQLSRVFGDRVVSEKPLDEVVLDYLVENARKKKKRTVK